MNRIEKLGRLARTFFHYRLGSPNLPYAPLRMWVESTNQCNLRCKVCPNSTDMTSVRGNMGMDLYRSIIAQTQGCVNDFNLSHRGEPLFHPELETMVALAKQAGIGSRIHTNATCLDRDRSNRLLHAAPDLVSFSFDGFDKTSYESVRVGGIFEVTLENIEYFLEEKRRLGIDKPYTIIQIILPDDATPDYRDHLERFGAGFESKGLDKFYIKKPHNWGGNTPGVLRKEVGYIPCTFLHYSMTVLFDGTVCPCPQDWYGSMPLGNLNKQSLEEIWNGKPYAELRMRMRRRDLDGLLCSNCDRVFRPSFMGIPTENLKAFFGETVAGYRLVRKIIRR